MVTSAAVAVCAGSAGGHGPAPAAATKEADTAAVTKPVAAVDGSGRAEGQDAGALQMPLRRTRGENEGVIQIGTVVMGVDDIGRASAFWRRALGYAPRDGELRRLSGLSVVTAEETG